MGTIQTVKDVSGYNSILFRILVVTIQTGIDVCVCSINTLSTKDEKSLFAISIDPDEVAHNEPPHLGLHCLPSRL